RSREIRAQPHGLLDERGQLARRAMVLRARGDEPGLGVGELTLGAATGGVLRLQRARERRGLGRRQEDLVLQPGQARLLLLARGEELLQVPPHGVETLARQLRARRLDDGTLRDDAVLRDDRALRIERRERERLAGGLDDDGVWQ